MTFPRSDTWNVPRLVLLGIVDAFSESQLSCSEAATRAAEAWPFGEGRAQRQRAITSAKVVTKKATDT
jgi:hypothetical protein